MTARCERKAERSKKSQTFFGLLAGLSSFGGGASYNRGFRRTLSRYRWSAEELVYRPTEDSLAVGLLWLIGLYIIGVPAAPLWALLGALFQFVPQIGAVLGVIGPALTAMFKWGDWDIRSMF